MDMTRKSTFCDYFVVMSAPSTVRVKAIVDHLEESLETNGVSKLCRDGYLEARWVLLDCGEVIVHVFHHETREFYDLETLWGDAPKRRFS